MYIVFGDTNIEVVSRLKLIFERFRKHNLYMKASKCFFGYSELEFVGKVVTHCEQTAEELFGNSELSQRLC